MTGAGALLAATVAVPLIVLLACLSRRAKAYIPTLLALAPVPGLAAAVLAVGEGPVVLPAPFFHATLELDKAGALLLGVAALLWIAAGATAAMTMRDKAAGSFAAWWLVALTGNLGIFMAADLPTFYLFFAMGSLSAYGLIVHDGTATAERAGLVYVGLALLGEACVLMGLVLLAAETPTNSLLIRDVVAALPQSPWRDASLALLIAGFGLKIGLVPLHVWMPLAYSAASLPAAAVLSGAAVKAGVIGFIRFLPFGVAIPDWGHTLAAIGLFSAFYGVAIGITQSNPKTILAYSSVSQMGLIAAVIGMGLAAGDGGTASAVAFTAAHHVLVKGALFLAIGVVAATGARGLWPVLLPAVVIALGLAGLPFTGGALAKVAVKSSLGYGLAGLLAALAAAGTTLLMLHFLERLRAVRSENANGEQPAELRWPWLAMAAASIVVPWATFPSVFPDQLADVFSLRSLGASLWPVLLGGFIAVLYGRELQGLPRIPTGDIVVMLDGAVRRAVTIGKTFERADGVLRRWPVAGASLLTLAIVLGAAIIVGN